VLERAGEIMASLKGYKEKAQPPTRRSPVEKANGLLKPNAGETRVLKEINETEIISLTPLEAINLIQQWKKLLESSSKGKLSPDLSKSSKNTSGKKTGEPSLFD
jgi:hypothetical protein